MPIQQVYQRKGARMCTRAMWTTPGGVTLVGRSMDWAYDTRTNIWALPAGMQRDGLVDDGLAWTAQFGKRRFDRL